MSDPNPPPEDHPSLEDLLATGAPFTFAELESAVRADAAFTGEEDWTLPNLLQEVHVNLIRDAMRQLGRDSYCFVPKHSLVDFAKLARRKKKRDAREKARKEKEERAFARERDDEEPAEKEHRVEKERVEEQSGEERIEVEQAAKDLAAWNQRVSELHAKELEAEEMKKKTKPKKEPKKPFWPEKTRPWPFPG